MDGPRRRLLAAAGGLAASLAGCVTSLTEPRDHAPESPGRESGEPTTTETTAPTEYPSTVEANVTVDREDIEYVEHNDTVRYVAGYESRYPDGKDAPPERDPVYEHLPFEEWAGTECVRVGSERVYEAMDERLDGNLAGVSAGTTRDGGEMAVLVVHRTTLDRDGDVVSEPAVPYQRVERVAPERVAVRFSFAGRTRSCTVPVVTREMEVQRE